jgi:hypothetical protein
MSSKINNQIDSSNLRDSKNSTIFYTFEGREESISLGDFELNIEGNYRREEDKGIYGNIPKINAAAKRVYSQMNPDYYKANLSLGQRFVLCILNLVSSDYLAKQLAGIVASYLSNNENLPFLIKDEEKDAEIIISMPSNLAVVHSTGHRPTHKRETVKQSDSPKSSKSDPWQNPVSYHNFLLNEKIESYLRKTFPLTYPPKKHIDKKTVADFKENSENSKIVAKLKNEVEKKLSKKTSSIATSVSYSSSQQPHETKYRDEIRYNEFSFVNMFLLPKVEEKLKKHDPQKYPADKPISREILLTYLRENPTYEKKLRNEITKHN